MAKSFYYIYRVSCNGNNNKARELQRIISRYNRTLVEFDDEDGLTPQKMLQCLQNYLAALNQNYRGQEVYVIMTDFDGIINFAFHVPNKGESIASFALCSVVGLIDCEENL